MLRKQKTPEDTPKNSRCLYGGYKKREGVNGVHR